MATHFLTPMLAPAAAHGRQMMLWNERSGRPLATHLEGAFDSASRRRGLLGRDGFAKGSALIIAPCQAVHTFRMRFPIDIVFADRQGRVVHVRSHVGARRLAGAWRAFAAIELPAGASQEADVHVGDRLVVAETPRSSSQSSA
jgi:uncharacterized membrane protein (UPF0127 family)